MSWKSGITDHDQAKPLHVAQILPGTFFNNPALHVNNPADDFFLIEEYVLLGKRARDPDNYENVKTLIYDLLAKTDLCPCGIKEEGLPGADEKTDVKDSPESNHQSHIYDPWIMETGNIEKMVDFPDSKEQFDKARKAKAPGDRLRELKVQTENRRRLLNIFLPCV